jgi:hypothetical protein
MTSKIFVLVCLLGLLIAPNMAWSAKMSRGACVNAVNQKLGTYATDRGLPTNKDAVKRCMKYGPGAID